MSIINLMRICVLYCFLIMSNIHLAFSWRGNNTCNPRFENCGSELPTHNRQPQPTPPAPKFDQMKQFADLNIFASQSTKFKVPQELQTVRRSTDIESKRIAVQAAIENYKNREISELSQDAGKYGINFVPSSLALGTIKYTIWLVDLWAESSNVLPQKENREPYIYAETSEEYEITIISEELRDITSFLYFKLTFLPNDKKSPPFSRTFAYKVGAWVAPNSFEIKAPAAVELKIEQKWRYTVTIYNPYYKVISCKIKSDFKDPNAQIEFDIPDYATSKNKIPAIKEKNLPQVWSIQPNSTEEVLRIIFSSTHAGDHGFSLLISIDHELLQIPFRMIVLRQGLNFNSYFYDFGIITKRKVGHEISIYASNNRARDIEIKDIIPMVNDQKHAIIATKPVNLNIPPHSENVLVCHFELSPASYESPEIFEGKITFVTDENRCSGNCPQNRIEISFQAAYFEKAFLISPSDQIIISNPSYSVFSSQDVKQLEQETAGCAKYEISKSFKLASNFSLHLSLNKLVRVSGEIIFTSRDNSTALTPKKSTANLEYQYTFSECARRKELQVFALPINLQNLFFFVPVQIFDPSLTCTHAQSGNAKIVDQCKSINGTFDLNFAGFHYEEVRNSTIWIRNGNPISISVNRINNPCNNLLIELFSHSKKQKIPLQINQGAPDHPQYTLSPGEEIEIKFRLSVKEPEMFEGNVTIFTETELIIFMIKYHAHNGTITSVPSQINFNPAFPGVVQTRMLHLRNTFPTEGQILKIESNDTRFWPVSYGGVLYPQSASAQVEIAFDPAVENTSETSQRNDYLVYARYMNQAKYSLTYYDFYLAYKTHRRWIQISAEQGQHVTAALTVTADIAKPFQIQAAGTLIMPEIVDSTVIDFGMIEIAEEAVKQIRIRNPSDHPLFVQFHIGPEDYEDPESLRKMFERVEKTHPEADTHAEWKPISKKIASNVQISDEVEEIAAMTRMSYSKHRQQQNLERVHDSLSTKLKAYLTHLFVQPSQANASTSSDNPQEFFLHSEIKGRSFSIAPHSFQNFNAIIFSPSSVKQSKGILYIRNNLTGVTLVKLSGIGGTGRLAVIPLRGEFSDIPKRSLQPLPEEDEYQKRVSNWVEFQLTAEDLHSAIQTQEGEFAIRREIQVQNVDKIPVQVRRLSIQTAGCKGYGFEILNCEPFRVLGNEKHTIQLQFLLDVILQPISPTIYLYTPMEVLSIRISFAQTDETLFRAIQKESAKISVFENVTSTLAIIISLVAVLQMMLKVIIDFTKVRREIVICKNIRNDGPKNIIDEKMSSSPVHKAEISTSSVIKATQQVKEEAEVTHSQTEKITNEDSKSDLPVTDMTKKSTNQNSAKVNLKEANSFQRIASPEEVKGYTNEITISGTLGEPPGLGKLNGKTDEQQTQGRNQDAFSISAPDKPDNYQKGVHSPTRRGRYSYFSNYHSMLAQLLEESSHSQEDEDPDDDTLNSSKVEMVNHLLEEKDEQFQDTLLEQTASVWNNQFNSLQSSKPHVSRFDFARTAVEETETDYFDPLKFFSKESSVL